MYIPANDVLREEIANKVLDFKLFKVQFFIHCTRCSGLYNFLNIEKYAINLISLKSHGRVEYYNIKYFGKDKN